MSDTTSWDHLLSTVYEKAKPQMQIHDHLATVVNSLNAISDIVGAKFKLDIDYLLEKRDGLTQTALDVFDSYESEEGDDSYWDSYEGVSQPEEATDPCL